MKGKGKEGGKMCNEKCVHILLLNWGIGENGWVRNKFDKNNYSENNV